MTSYGTLTYNLSEKRLLRRNGGPDFQPGDVYLFKSGSPQTCHQCRKGIPSGLRHVIQRRVNQDNIQWNDRYHLNCCPGWLTIPVSQILEEEY